MKTTAVVVPLVVVSLIFGLVWSVSLLTLKAGTEAIDSNLELLRLHMRVARLHEALLVYSRQSLESQLGELDALAGQAAVLRTAEAAYKEPGPLTPTGDPGPEIDLRDAMPAPMERPAIISSPAE